MKFSIEHAYENISVAEYCALHFDETFNIALCKATHLLRTQPDLRHEGALIVRAVTIAPERALPAPLMSLLGNKNFQYVEHVRFDTSSYSGTWTVEPALLADKLKSAGTLRFEKTREGQGVKRIVEGEISVKIFGLGGIIEKLVLEDVKKSYDDAAGFTKDYLKNR